MLLQIQSKHMLTLLTWKDIGSSVTTRLKKQKRGTGSSHVLSTQNSNLTVKKMFENKIGLSSIDFMRTLDNLLWRRNYIKIQSAVTEGRWKTISVKERLARKGKAAAQGFLTPAMSCHRQLFRWAFFKLRGERDFSAVHPLWRATEDSPDTAWPYSWSLLNLGDVS